MTGPCQCLTTVHEHPAWQADHADHCCLRDGTGNAPRDWCHRAEWAAAVGKWSANGQSRGGVTHVNASYSWSNRDGATRPVAKPTGQPLTP